MDQLLDSPTARANWERDVLTPENFFEILFEPLKADPRYDSIVKRLQGR